MSINGKEKRARNHTIRHQH